MKVLKWILLVAAAAASTAAVVYAVLRRTGDCCCCVTNLIAKGKALVQPCCERVCGFFTENDFVDDIVEDIAE